MLCWQNDDNLERYASGRCTSVSTSGISIQLNGRIAARTFVNFHVPDLDLRGAGSVRHCYRKGLQHVVGIEFSGGLQLVTPTPATTLKPKAKPA